MRLDIGKLPAPILGRFLQKMKVCDRSVIVGPKIGEDAAVLDLGDVFLVAASDPITFAADQIGWYAVQVNANDIACCGAEPRWFLATILLPENSEESLAASIFDQVTDACACLDMTIIGGHTEVTRGLERPIVVGTALGTVDPKSYVTTSGAQIGDIVLLTKGIAIEGTSILARERGAAISSLSHSELEDAARLIFEPGISVVKDALTAAKGGRVHAMHDPTEGGLASAIRELASASNVGARIDISKVPVISSCRKICEHFGIDPLGLLASGALLVVVPPSAKDAIVNDLLGIGIPTNVIGEIVTVDNGCTAYRKQDDSTFPLPAFDKDEIAKIL